MTSKAIRLLIVEDEDVLRSGLTSFFEGENFAVTGVPDAESALALLSRARVDAVLLDNCLPGMMGLTALPRLKKLSGAPVVLMTGHATGETERDARLLGAEGFVAKPLVLPAVAALLRDLASAPQ